MVKQHLIFFFLSLTCGSVFAQRESSVVNNQPLEDFPFHITYFNSKHGLPQNQISAFTIDQNSMLYVATTNGVARFNGSEFLPVVAHPDHKKHIFMYLHWSKLSNELFGISSLGEYYQLYPNYSYLEKGIFHGEIKNDTLYSIDRKGTIRISDISYSNFYDSIETNCRDAHALLVKDKAYYVVNNDGLFFIDNSKKVTKYDFKAYGLKYSPEKKRVIVLGRNKMMMMGQTDTMVVSFDRYIDKSKPLSRLNDIFFLDSSRYIVSSTEGLLYFDGEKINHFASHNGLLSNSYGEIMYIKEGGVIFIGSNINGVMRMTPKRFKVHKLLDYSSEQSYRSVLQHNGAVYTIMSGGKLLKLQNDKLIHQKEYQILPAFASLSSIDESLFIGTWGDGLYIYQDADHVTHLSEKKLGNEHVLSSLKDSKGNYWIGTYENICFGRKINEIAPLPGIKDRVVTIHELAKNIVLGGQSSVYFLDSIGNLLHTIGKEQGLNAKEVRSFYEDESTGNLFIGTYGGGTALYYHSEHDPHAKLGQGNKWDMTHEEIDAALTKREVRKHTINFYRLFTDQHYYENILQQYCHSNRYYTIIFDNLQPLKREDISVELYKGYRWW